MTTSRLLIFLGFLAVVGARLSLAETQPAAPVKPVFDRAAFETWDQARRLALVRAALDWREAQLANFSYELSELIRNVNSKTREVVSKPWTRPYSVIRRGDQFLFSGTEHSGTPGQSERRFRARWDGLVYRSCMDAGEIDPPGCMIRPQMFEGVINVEFNNLLGFRTWGVETYVNRRQERVHATLPQWIEIYSNHRRLIEVELDDADDALIRFTGFDGFQSYSWWLDPVRDFMPVRAAYRYRHGTYEHGAAQRLDDAKQVDAFWVPMQTTVTVKLQVNSEQQERIYTIAKFTRGDVGDVQLHVDFPERAKVVDIVGGFSYEVKNGTPTKVEPLFDPRIGKVSVKTDEDLADALAANPIVDDVSASPQRRQKIAEILSRQEQRRREADRVTHKPALPFPAAAVWLNGEPMTWEQLRGQIVVLDFFAEWCGPCENDYPLLAARARNNKSFMIIGVHAAGSEFKTISKLLGRFKMNYPVCIDVPASDGKSWGATFAAFGVEGIPHAAVIDANGVVAAQGTLEDALTAAYELKSRK